MAAKHELLIAVLQSFSGFQISVMLDNNSRNITMVALVVRPSGKIVDKKLARLSMNSLK